jgi:hypothetical protein
MNPTRSASPSLLDIRRVALVLVSGRMALADGSEVDSRQPTCDQATARAVQSALTATPEWWAAVSSVVLPTLEDARGGFALLIGSRSIARATGDGEIRRSSLKRALRGGIGTVSVQRSGINEELPADYERLATLRNWQGDHMGAVGVRTDGGSSRWRFFSGTEFYLRVVAGILGARVVVDTTGAFVTNAYGPLDLGSLSAEFAERATAVGPEVVVLPDTAEMRARLDAVRGGRAIDPADGDVSAGTAAFDRTAPRDPAEFLQLAVLRASCNVGGLLRAGEWEDGGDLEAARNLLLERFDLKLGLWDLALNPVLRSTVLDSGPAPPAPKEVAQPPAVARTHAARAAAKATSRRDAARRGAHQMVVALHKELRSVGWRLDDREVLSRPLTEPLSNWPDSPKGPLVALRIEVTKSAVRVLVWHWLYNDLDINAFIESRRAAFEAVAGHLPAVRDTASVTLWSAEVGWGDADADWRDTGTAIAGCTKRWEALLADFVTSCRDTRRARLARHRS